MPDVDLPEPKRRHLSFTEKSERRWKLIRTFLILTALYSGLHKVIIPVVLKFTTLSSTVYAEVDWWVVIAVSILYFVIKENRFGFGIAIFCGAAIMLSIGEWCFVFMNRYPGWLTLSKILSTAPFATVCSLTMVFYSSNKEVIYAWGGALVTAAVLLLEFRTHPEPIAAVKLVPNGVAMERREAESPVAVTHDRLCGKSNETYDSSAEPRFVTVSVVPVENCGFKISGIRVGRDQEMIFENQTDRPVNIHLLLSQSNPQAKKPGWNVLVAPKTRRTAPKFSLTPGGVGLIYSDSFSAAGIIAIVSDETNGRWHFSRNPIMMKKEEK